MPPQPHTPRHFSAGEIDLAVATLRALGGDHIVRSHYGGGYAYRDGTFFLVSVEWCDRSEQAFANEADLRRHLATLDLDSRDRSDLTSAIRQLLQKGASDTRRP